MIEQWSREKLSLCTLEPADVWLYDWLCLMATIDASLGSHPTRGRKYKGWETSILYFTDALKVTGTQCSPMYQTWISCGLPSKRGSLRLWKFVSPKTTSLKKHLPWRSPPLLSTMKKEKLSFQIIQTHWLCRWISRIQEAKKPWHNSHSSYQNIILKPTPSCRH